MAEKDGAGSAVLWRMRMATGGLWSSLLSFVSLCGAWVGVLGVLMCPVPCCDIPFSSVHAGHTVLALDDRPALWHLAVCIPAA